jgi:hypothetical protein
MRAQRYGRTCKMKLLPTTCTNEIGGLDMGMEAGEGLDFVSEN